MDENDRAIVWFVMVGHLMVHTYELSLPIFMTVWLGEFQTTTATLGVAAAIGYGFFGIGALPGGLLVDKFGSRILISSCLAGMGISFLALAFVPGVVGVTIALAFWGAAGSVYHPAGLTLISNGVNERGKGFAYHGMAGNLGIAGGPLLTAILLLMFDWRLVAIILSIPAVVATVVGMTIQFDPTAVAEVADGGGQQASPSSVGEFIAETRRLFTVGFLLIFTIVSLNGLFYRGILTFLPGLLGDFLQASIGDVHLGLFAPSSPLAEEFNLSQYLYAGLLTVGIGGQYLGGRLTEVIEPERGLVVMLPSLSLIALLFVPAAQMGLWGLLLISITLGLALFAIQPLTQATITKYTNPKSRGVSFGFTYLAIFGVGALGAAITGMVLTYTSVMVMFIVLAAFGLVAAFLAMTLVRWDS